MEFDHTAREYIWRDSGRIKGVDANDAAEVLKSIYDRDGSIQAQAIVNEARPKESPIHQAFEWRDKVAGEEYRKWQARNMTRCIRAVEAPNPASEPVVIKAKVSSSPAFFFAGNGNEDKPAGYYPASSVLTDLDLFDRALQEALAKLKAAERSVDELKRMAEKTEERDTLMALSIAVTALSTATAAIREVRH